MKSMRREQAIEHGRILHEGLQRIAMCAEDDLTCDAVTREEADILVAHTLKARKENDS